MKVAAAVVLLLALASVASARPVGLRSVLSDKKEPRYCEVDYAGEDECHAYGENLVCKALDKEVCVYGKCWTGKCVPKKTYGRRAVLSDKKEPRYCEVDYAGEDECHAYGENLVCTALDKEVCVYGKCWTGKCVPKKTYGRRAVLSDKKEPRYCEVDYDGEDECHAYEEDLECKELEKEECVYEKECEHVDTDECLKYNQKRECKQGKCIKYDYGKCTKYGEDVCEYVKTSCKEYKQKEVCKDVKVCWTGKCVARRSYGRK